MTRRDSKSGQIFVLLAFFLAGLVLLGALCADTFFAIRGKTRDRNTADAAALAAARWQGETLNLIGELNLAHLAATAESNMTAAAGIAALQERLAFAGPLNGFLAANRLARANGADIDRDMTTIVEASLRMTDALATTPNWTTKGADYRQMLQAILDEGICAGCDNAQLLDVAGESAHPLLCKDFYASAAAENWCQICYRHGGFFADDTDRDGHAGMIRWLATFALEIPIASLAPRRTINPEFFGTSLGAHAGYLANLDYTALTRLTDTARDHGLDVDVAQLRRFRAADTNLWFVYSNADYMRGWRSWNEMDRYGERAIPIVGDVQPRYNVFGASAVSRIYGGFAPLVSSGETNRYTTIAAAKPFGALPGDRRVIDLFDNDDADPLVFPSFAFVRLIPLFGANESTLDNADLTWAAHKNYLLGSPLDLEHKPGCPYCIILGQFEATRAKGAEFLSGCEHHADCVPPPRGEGGHIGGVGRVP